MPYLSDHNILYLHAPKTAEASVHDYFHRKLKVSLNMDDPYTLQMFRADMKINAYTFIFGSVINPYTRTIHDLYAHHVINGEMNREEVEGMLVAFLNDSNLHTPQYPYFTNENDEIDPNVKVVKHETLEQDMVAIGFDNFKATHTESYDQLTLKSVLAINKLYAKDFEHFGYEQITNQEQLDALYTPVAPKSTHVDPPIDYVRVLRSAPRRLLGLNFYR